VHGDHFAGVDDLNRKFAPAGMVRQLTPYDRFVAYKNDLYAKTFDGLDRPLNFGFGGVIAAHCVDSNGHHKGALFLNHLDYFAAFILSAVRTNAVGELRFVTVRAFGNSLRLQTVMRA